MWSEPRGGCGLDVMKGLGTNGPDVGVVLLWLVYVCVCSQAADVARYATHACQVSF